MEKRRYYVTNSGDCEKIIREFLFKKATKVRFTAKEEVSIINFGRKKRYGGLEDALFLKTLKRLEEELLKKNNYQDKFLFWNYEENYYWYKLSPKIKRLFNRVTLLFPPLYQIIIEKKSHCFYGLEDPFFYQGQKLLGFVINHERDLCLYLTAAEKEQLKEKGVELE